MLGITTLPFKKYSKNSHKEPVIFELPDDCILEQWIVPKGTTIKLLTTTNFGFVHLPEGTKDKRGFVIPRRIFKY